MTTDKINLDDTLKIVDLLLKEDKHGVSLYTEETGPDVVRGANFIPAALIKEIIMLGPVKRPVKRKPKPSAPIERTEHPGQSQG